MSCLTRSGRSLLVRPPLTGGAFIGFEEDDERGLGHRPLGADDRVIPVLKKS